MSKEPARFSDSIEIPLSELDKGIADVVPAMAPPPRWAAFNAIRHLNSSWRLRSLDPEMAAFRAITAEEEAATALFLSLKRRHYRGAQWIKHHNHVHKNGVIPFVDSVSRLFERFRTFLPRTELYFDTAQSPARLVLRLKLPNPATGELVWAHPQPPLHFSFSSGGKEKSSSLYTFEREIQQIATETGVATIIEHIKERANLRNKLLYSASEGYPDISGDIELGLRSYQRNVFVILKIYLMVDPYPNQQNFIQQCLDAYLNMLKLVPPDVSFE
jgi:hypothetical protein